jgi:hypothetical protein
MQRGLALIAFFLVTGCERARDVAPIRLEPLTTIGAEDGAEAMTAWPLVSPQHPGGYRVLVPQSPGGGALPMAFGDDGRRIDSIGSFGTGQEHLSEPLFVRFGPGDSLYLFDGARRVLIYSPDRRYQRTVALPVTPWDAAILADGRMVVSSSLYEHPLPLLILRADGTIEREIGGTDSASMAVRSPRRVIPGPDGTIWTMPMTGRWRLEQWSLDGTLRRTLDRTPDWYPASQPAALTASPTPRQPTLQAAWFDAAGRLWVLGKAVDADWEKGMRNESDSGAVASIDDPDRVGDTMLEVFDAAVANLVATARFDDVYPFSAEPGVVIRIRSSDRGWHRAELARIVLDTTRLVATRP